MLNTKQVYMCVVEVYVPLKLLSQGTVTYSASCLHYKYLNRCLQFYAI